MPTPAPVQYTLDNCNSLRIWFEPDGLTAINIPRIVNGPRKWKPAKLGQAYRELQPGDKLIGPNGEVRIVRSVEPH